MKKKALIIVLSLIVAAMATYAQEETRKHSFTLGMDAGYSINHAPVAGVNLGFNFPNWNIRTGFLVHMSNKVQDGVLPFIKIGKTVEIGERLYMTAAAGYAYSYKSADIKSLNKNMLIFSPEIGYKFTLTTRMDESPMAFYIGGTQTYNLADKSFKDFTILNIGLRGYF